MDGTEVPEGEKVPIKISWCVRVKLREEKSNLPNLSPICSKTGLNDYERGSRQR